MRVHRSSRSSSRLYRGIVGLKKEGLAVFNSWVLFAPCRGDLLPHPPSDRCLNCLILERTCDGTSRDKEILRPTRLESREHQPACLTEGVLVGERKGHTRPGKRSNCPVNRVLEITASVTGNIATRFGRWRLFSCRVANPFP